MYLLRFGIIIKHPHSLVLESEVEKLKSLMKIKFI